MPYITMQVNPSSRQLTLEEVLDGDLDPALFQPSRNAPSSTKTVYRAYLPQEFINRFNVPGMIRVLREFTVKYAALYEQNRRSLYDHFEIPKSTIDPETGTFGVRPIDAPHSELKLALYELKSILENQCGASYHTNAFAYIPHRCAVDAIRRHQANHSKWFLKTDFHNFFGSTTPAFTKPMLSMIFPFSEIYRDPEGEQVLDKALDLCFLDGGLPQGTPISPMLTNLFMIPIDHRLANVLRNHNDIHYIYTRYADDMQISSKVKFNYHTIVDYINQTLEEFEAPFRLKDSKTRFGSANGHNFNLGVILNENNDITIGYKRKMAFRSQIYDYLQHRLRNDPIPMRDLQVMAGLLSYYSSIEPDYWRQYIDRFNQKNHVDLNKIIIADLNAAVKGACADEPF